MVAIAPRGVAAAIASAAIPRLLIHEEPLPKRIWPEKSSKLTADAAESRTTCYRPRMEWMRERLRRELMTREGMQYSDPLFATSAHLTRKIFRMQMEVLPKFDVLILELSSLANV
uniref:Uncharacterized protein n=1 Tax=Oryza punctata TaxID=4537 RepID=A0A0E0LC97_ORYPU